MANSNPTTTTSGEADALVERVRTLETQNKQFAEKAARDKTLKPYQVELLKLQRHLEAEQIPMIVLFEGRDASGKGGTIRRITRFMTE